MKTLNEVVTGDKFASIEYLKEYNTVQDVVKNLTVMSVREDRLLVTDEYGNKYNVIKDNVINYSIKQRMVTVEYQEPKDFIPKIFPKYEVIQEIDSHLLLKKDVNGTTIHRLLEKEYINELWEMN